jgi:hypothetical protein
VWECGLSICEHRGRRGPVCAKMERATHRRAAPCGRADSARRGHSPSTPSAAFAVGPAVGKGGGAEDCECGLGSLCSWAARHVNTCQIVPFPPAWRDAPRSSRAETKAAALSAASRAATEAHSLRPRRRRGHTPAPLAPEQYLACHSNAGVGAQIRDEAHLNWAGLGSWECSESHRVYYMHASIDTPCDPPQTRCSACSSDPLTSRMLLDKKKPAPRMRAGV